MLHINADKSSSTTMPNWLVFDKFDFSFKIVSSDGELYNPSDDTSPDLNCAKMVEIAYSDKFNNYFSLLNGESLFVVYNKNATNPCVEESSSGIILPLRNKYGNYFRNNNNQILCAYKNRGLKFISIKVETDEKIILSSLPQDFTPIPPTGKRGFMKKSFEETVAQRTRMYCENNPDSAIADNSLLKQALRNPLYKNRVAYIKKALKKPTFDYTFAAREKHAFGYTVYAEKYSPNNEILAPVVYTSKDGYERSCYEGKQLYLKKRKSSRSTGFLNTEQGRRNGIIRFFDENGEPIKHSESGKVLCAYKDESLVFVPTEREQSLLLDKSTWDYLPFLRTQSLDTIFKYAMPPLSWQIFPTMPIKIAQLKNIKLNADNFSDRYISADRVLGCKISF